MLNNYFISNNERIIDNIPCRLCFTDVLIQGKRFESGKTILKNSIHSIQDQSYGVRMEWRVGFNRALDVTQILDTSIIDWFSDGSNLVYTIPSEIVSKFMLVQHHVFFDLMHKAKIQGIQNPIYKDKSPIHKFIYVLLVFIQTIVSSLNGQRISRTVFGTRDDSKVDNLNTLRTFIVMELKNYIWLTREHFNQNEFHCDVGGSFDIIKELVDDDAINNQNKEDIFNGGKIINLYSSGKITLDAITNYIWQTRPHWELC